ncbi:MAG TPA: recombinase family protein [Baekduia sp.]|nr:recombinase family protein [Baekduia sp.]
MSPTSGRPAQEAQGTALAYITRPGDRRVIASACRRMGLELVDVLHAGDEGDGSPLGEALEAVAAGRAGCVMVRRLADLDGQPGGMARLLERVAAGGVRLVVLDIGLDTADETGALALQVRPHREAPWLPADDAAEAAQEPPAPAEPEPEREPEPVATAERSGPEPVAAPVAAATPPPPEPAPAPAAGVAARSIGYACATGPQDRAGADLAAQRAIIEHRCAEDRLELVELIGDREPRDGKALDRPGLSHALRRIAAGDARCLVVARLDHLSHSVAELGRIIAWLNRAGVRLIAVDLGMDTGTDAGRTTARALASVGDWERERLSERTRAGLEAARQKRRLGTGTDAERVGALRQRIAGMRADGMTLQAIADVLNDEGVPTQRGGTKWRPSSVQSAAGYKRPTRRRRSADLPEPGVKPAGPR